MACRTARPKEALLRVVRAPDRSIRLDPTGRANGRGAYVCRSRSCIEDAINKGALSRALGTPVSPELRTWLGEAVGPLDDEGGTGGQE